MNTLLILINGCFHNHHQDRVNYVKIKKQNESYDFSIPCTYTLQYRIADLLYYLYFKKFYTQFYTCITLTRSKVLNILEISLRSYGDVII